MVKIVREGGRGGEDSKVRVVSKPMGKWQEMIVENNW